MFVDSMKTNVPTELLRTLVTVCELRSFTKAAQLLQLTQPAVSEQIRKLEIIIGREIINRRLSGINLTPSGVEVLKSAQRLLSINDQIVFECGTEVGLQVIRFGVPNLLAPVMLPSIVREVRAHAPDAHLQICCENSPSLLRMLRLGYLDITFAYFEPGDGTDAVASWVEELGWVRAADFEMAAGEPVPLISSPSLLQVDRTAVEMLKRAKLRYRIMFSAVDFGARFAAAAAGLGYMPLTKRITPAGLVREERLLPPLGSFEIGLFVRDEFEIKGRRSFLSALRGIGDPQRTVV
jgi:DNA-binding transcriptional LysR family regulator